MTVSKLIDPTRVLKLSKLGVDLLWQEVSKLIDPTRVLKQ